MVELIGNKLEELGLEVLWQLRPKNFPSLTFSFVSESGQEFTDEGEVETEYIIQVDVWSKDDYEDLVKQVKDKLSEIECYRTYETDDYEETNEIYHKILRFSHLRSKGSEESV